MERRAGLKTEKNEMKTTADDRFISRQREICLAIRHHALPALNTAAEHLVELNKKFEIKETKKKMLTCTEPVFYDVKTKRTAATICCALLQVKQASIASTQVTCGESGLCRSIFTVQGRREKNNTTAFFFTL